MDGSVCLKVHLYRGDKALHSIRLSVGVPRRQPHRRSGLATLTSVGAIP